MKGNLQKKEILQGTTSTKEFDVNKNAIQQPGQISETRSTLSKASNTIQDLEEDQVILHITDQENQEFPDELNELINLIITIDNEVDETRRIYLNNNWQVTDSIGNPDFVGLIENNSNKGSTILHFRKITLLI